MLKNQIFIVLARCPFGCRRWAVHLCRLRRSLHIRVAALMVVCGVWSGLGFSPVRPALGAGILLFILQLAPSGWCSHHILYNFMLEDIRVNSVCCVRNLVSAVLQRVSFCLCCLVD